MKNGRTPVVVSIVLSVIALSLVSAAEPGAAPAFDDRTAFEALKALAGNWEGKTSEHGEQPVAETFRVIAGGSVVLEDMFPGTPHEMMTVYHMDGDRLVLTHYCAIGNQPRMRFEKTGRPGEIRFAFAGGTNLRADRDEHMHEVTIRLAGGRLESEWVSWKDGARGHAASFALARKP